jgi:hypothetical protein
MMKQWFKQAIFMRGFGLQLNQFETDLSLYSKVPAGFIFVNCGLRVIMPCVKGVQPRWGII